MVLTFSNWTTYTDETGTSRSIDWENLEGHPRAAAVEAIRQAIVQRFQAFSSDYEAEIAAAVSSYSYAAAMAGYVVSAVPEGVDLDCAPRLAALSECIRKLLQVCVVHEATVASMGGTLQYAYETDYPALATQTSGPFTSTDPFSAAWAREAKAALDHCHAVYAAPGSYPVASTISYVPTLFASPRTIATRDIWHIETPAGPYPAPADLATALAAETWAQAPAGYSYSSLLLRYIGVWADSSTAYAYRQRSVWSIPAVPFARRVDYMRNQTGTLPEAAHSAQEVVSIGPGAGALSGSEGDSQALADPPETTYPTYPQGHAWASTPGVFADFAVSGGLTLQEAA